MKDTYVFVTGAATRLGRAIALELVEMGYNLVLHYRSSKEKATALKHEIESKGRKVELVQFDFLNAPDYEKTFIDLKEKGIIVEVLVNSASYFVPSKFLDSENQSLLNDFRSNFESAYLLTKSFARVFEKGSVINMLDTKITKDDTKHFDYLLSKKLLADFTRMTALTLAPNIRVNGICPGLVLPPEGKDESYLLDLAQHIPLKKIGGTRDIQRAVRFLTESDFITGQFIFIDGGDHLSR